MQTQKYLSLWVSEGTHFDENLRSLAESSIKNAVPQGALIDDLSWSFIEALDGSGDTRWECRVLYREQT